MKIWKIFTVVAFLSYAELAIFWSGRNAVLGGALAGLIFGLMTAGANGLAGKKFEWRTVEVWVVFCVLAAILHRMLKGSN